MKKLHIAITVLLAALLLSGCGHEHTPGDWEIITPATCAEAGTRQKLCTDCGEAVESESVAAAGHLEGEWTLFRAASCAEAGERRKVCQRCNYVIAQETLPAL